MPTPFIKLADPGNYIACSSDLCQDDEWRAHWIRFFKSHLNTVLKLGIDAAVVRGILLDDVTACAGACRVEFYDYFDAFAADPHVLGRHNGHRVTILTLNKW